MNSFDLLYFIAVYFLCILLFGGRQYRLHSAIIFLSSLLNIIYQLPIATTAQEYINNRSVFVLWDGAAGLLMITILKFDKVAWKQSYLLAFAVLCHSMIIYHLIGEKNWLSSGFYTYYDELIITVGILQMMVSYDGIVSSLKRIQNLVLRRRLHFNHSYKNTLTSKREKQG